MAEVAKKWFVVRTAGGKEKKAKEYIEKEIAAHGLGSSISQVLIPTEKYYQVKNGKRVSAERIFYPGYVLVECEVVPKKGKDSQDNKLTISGEIQHIIRNIPYVAGFLGEGKDKEPVPLRESEINRIMGRVDTLADQEDVTETPFVVGEAVKIIDGPFNGFDGNVEEIAEDKRKLKVMVKIFGRKTLLELNFTQVTKE